MMKIGTAVFGMVCKEIADWFNSNDEATLN